jgi:hypothetical protein
MKNTSVDVTAVILESPGGRILLRQQNRLLCCCATYSEMIYRDVARELWQNYHISVFILQMFRLDGRYVCVGRLIGDGTELPSGLLWGSEADVALADRDLIQDSQRRQLHHETQTSSYSQFGAIDALRRWYLPVLKKNDRVERHLEHWQSSSDSTLLQIQTDKNPVWLKAVGNEYSKEAGISEALARLSPVDFPRVIHTHSSNNLMLLEHVHGKTLAEVDDRQVWLAAAKRLAELQLRFVSEKDKLINAGCADWRTNGVQDSIAPFFAAMEQVMATQTSALQPALSADDLFSVQKLAIHLCQLLENCCVPDTLVHANFSPHNVIWSHGRPVFIDWAFGIVGFPFVSLEYFWRRMVRDCPQRSAWGPALSSAYYRVWNDQLDPAVLHRAKQLAPIAAPLIAGLNLYYRNPTAWQDDPVRAAALRTLVRTFANAMQQFMAAGESQNRSFRTVTEDVAGAQRPLLFTVFRNQGHEVLVHTGTQILPRFSPSNTEKFDDEQGAAARIFTEAYDIGICVLLTFTDSDLQPEIDPDDLTLRRSEGTERKIVVGQCLDPYVTGADSLEWISTRDVKGDASDQQALTRALQLAWDGMVGRRKAPLTKYDWFYALFDKPAIAAAGIDPALAVYCYGNREKATFRLRQPNVDAWLKVVSLRGATSSRVLQTLCSLNVPHMPAVIGFASHVGEWDAALQQHIPGLDLDRDQRPESWIAAAERTAEIQMATIGRSEYLRASGCPAWTIAHLVEQAEQLFRWLSIDVFKQPKSLPCIVSAEDRDRVLAQLNAVATLDLPHTLTKTNLPYTQVVVDASCGPIFIGCDSAAIGSPLVWYGLMAEAAQRYVAHESSLPGQMLDTYCTAWERRMPQIPIRDAMLHVSFVVAVTKAVRAAALPKVIVPDRFAQADQYEWALDLTSAPERMLCLKDALQETITTTVQEVPTA